MSQATTPGYTYIFARAILFLSPTQGEGRQLPVPRKTCMSKDNMQTHTSTHPLQQQINNAKPNRNTTIGACCNFGLQLPRSSTLVDSAPTSTPTSQSHMKSFTQHTHVMVHTYSSYMIDLHWLQGLQVEHALPLRWLCPQRP